MKRAEDGRELAALDPRRDPARWEAMVQGINRAVAGEMARRAVAAEPGVLLLLSRWRRPAAAVCTAIAASAAAILLLQPARGADTDGGVASALGYPEAVATWLETGEELSVEELLFAMEGESW